MMKRFFYLSLVAAVLFLGSSCKKDPNSGNHSGNVPGDTTKNPTGVDVPAGAKDGITFLNDGKSVIFNLYAPKKTSVSVIGEFNSWAANDASKMKNSKDGTRWWVQIDNLDPTKEYAFQYLVNGTLKVADPYTEKVLDPNGDSSIPSSVYPGLKAYPVATTGIVSTFWYSQPTYSWVNNSFVRPEPKNLVIYELLVRDFVKTHDYKTIKDTLNYFVRLGVNAIELMPISEFEGNDSWGYNPNFYFAPDKFYGTKNDLKALIDACHGKGIAVIQDIVLNHSFSTSPMVQLYYSGTPSTGAPTADNPWYNTVPRHPYNVGFQFNHESAATKYFVKNVLKWWMQEYHIDGYRFDLAKGFTQVNYGTSDAAVGPWGQYDASRVAIWKDYNNTMKAIDPKFYVILEDFASNQEENELANEGMMTWNNMSTNGEQATMSYNDAGGSWDLSALFYNTFSFTNPYAIVSYFESHDQERLQYKNGMFGNVSGGYSIKDLPTGLKRDEMGAAFMFSSPGPKMIWQFGERGYDISIDNGGRLGDKDPHWEYMADANRKALFALYAKMIKLKIKNPVFTTTNFQYDLGGTVKTIQLNGADGTNVEVVGNFGVTTQSKDIPFAAIGTWTDAITGATVNVTTLPFSMTLAPGEYHVYSNRALLQ